MIIYLSIFFIFIPDLKGQETCGSIQDPSARILCQQQSRIVVREFFQTKDKKIVKKIAFRKETI